jgi:hypothetical protein
LRFRLAAFLAASAVSEAAFAASTPDWVIRARATAVDPALLTTNPAPDAVILWRQQIVTAGSFTGATRLFRREAVRILTEEGLTAGTFTASYDDDSRVSIEGAWTLHADSSVEKLDTDSIVRVQVANPEYFTDTFVMAFRPPRLVAGDIAALALWRKSHRDVYQWKIALQDEHPIAAQDVSVDLPDGWRYRWRLTARPEGYAGPMFGEGGSKGSHVFGGQRGLPEERASPPKPDLSARMEISVLPPSGKFPELVFENWNQVATWFYRKSLPARTEAPRELSGSASEPVPASARWVQDKIRYVAVEVGEGGYVPREPALVARRLYGDCKDKTFLLLSLLGRRGVDAFPVLTRPRDSGAIDPDFPSPVQFNHVILAIRAPDARNLPAAAVQLSDGPVVLFDPTDPWTPYGQLPGSLQGARGLLVRRDGGDFLTFPVAPSAQNRLRRKIEGEIAEDGALTAVVTELSEGALSERGYYQTKTPGERANGILGFASQEIHGARGSQLELARLDDLASPLEAKFRVTADVFLQRIGALLLMPALPFSVGPGLIPGLNHRRFAIDLDVPKRRELQTFIRLPPGTRIESLPESISAENEYATYKASFSEDNGRVLATEVFEVRHPLVPVERLKDWRALENAASRAARTKIVLTRGN